MMVRGARCRSITVAESSQIRVGLRREGLGAAEDRGAARSGGPPAPGKPSTAITVPTAIQFKEAENERDAMMAAKTVLSSASNDAGGVGVGVGGVGVGDGVGFDKEKPYDCTVRLRFPTEHLAAVAMASLSADKELRGNKVSRTLAIVNDDDVSENAGAGGERCVLRATFRASELRLLRVCVSSFYDMASIIVRTQLEFAEIE